MEKRISLSTPHLSEEGYELEYINDVFARNWIAPFGENITELENTIGAYPEPGTYVGIPAGRIR